MYINLKKTLSDIKLTLRSSGCEAKCWRYCGIRRILKGLLDSVMTPLPHK